VNLKTFIFLIGFGLSVIGNTYIISYLNYLTIGYNFKEYVNFIIRRPECLLAILGLIMITLSIYKGDKNELYLWCIN